MRIRLLFPALAMVLVIGVRDGSRATAAEGASLQMPPYISPYGARIGLHTNGAWRDVDARLPARQVRKDEPASYTSADPKYYVWSKTCRPGRQTVHFRRTIWLPGPPRPFHDSNRITAPAGLVLEWTTPQVGPDTPRWVVHFNDRVAYRGPTLLRNETTLGRADLQLLRRGENVVDLTVTKPAMKCSEFDGVSFELGAAFWADVYVFQGGADRRYIDASGSVATQQSLLITVGNRGPSEAPLATFHLEFNAGSPFGTAHFDVIYTGMDPPFRCERTVENSKHTLDCVALHYAPARETKALVTVRFYPEQEQWVQAGVTFIYNITTFGPFDPEDPNIDTFGPTDTRGANNSRVLWLTFCGPLSTLPECEAAEGAEALSARSR